MSAIHRRRFGSLGSMLFVLALAVAFAAPSASTPVPQKGGNKTVFATAVDGDNKPVLGLTKAEWGVREDGKDRVLVELKPATDPLDVVLMVDTSQAIQSSITELRNALVSFGHDIIDGSPGATVTVMDVAGAAVPVGINLKTKDELDKVLGKTFADQMEIAVFMEGFMDAAKKLAKSPSPRRAIVVVNHSGVPDRSTIQPPRVIDEVVKSGASMWVVSYQSSTGSSSPAGGIGNANTGQNRDEIFNKVPKGTGGIWLTITVPTALEVTLAKIAAGLVGQYEVTYARPDGTPAKVLQMGQTRPGVRVVYPATPPK